MKIRTKKKEKTTKIRDVSKGINVKNVKNVKNVMKNVKNVKRHLPICLAGAAVGIAAVN